MKLCTLDKGKKQTLGAVVDEGIIDVEKALVQHPVENITADVMDIISGGTAQLQALEKYLHVLPLQGGEPYLLSPGDVTWGPAVTNPQKIICIGLNYRRHADETNAPYPESPILFSKFNNALTGHHHEVKVPEATEKLDYEAELAMVIGKTCENVTEQEALDYVFGYTPANDLSARDLQKKTPQWLLGKTCEGFCPTGPYLVTVEEAGDPQSLKLSTTVNGEARQQSSTSDMIFTCAEIISYISKHMTLVPGDMILTGTPEGVMMGYPEDQQVFLKPGDEVTVGIENLGTLTNTFV